MDKEARAALDGHMPETVNLPAPVGRPSGYNDEIAKKICDLIAKRHSFDEIGDMDDFPGRTTLYRWRKENEEFRLEIEAAECWRTESLLDQALKIATDGSKDHKIEIADEKGGPGVLVEVPESVKRSKLGVETIFQIVKREDAKQERRAAPAAPLPPGSQELLPAPYPIREINPRSAPPTIEHSPFRAEIDAVLKAADAASKS